MIYKIVNNDLQLIQLLLLYANMMTIDETCPDSIGCWYYPPLLEYLSIRQCMELDCMHGVRSHWQLLRYKIQYLRTILFLVYKLTKERMDVVFEHNTESFEICFEHHN